MSVNIRDIQHFMYCPRRFALLSINRDWAENVFVVKADIMHEYVHSGRHEIKNSKRIELSSVTVYNDELDIFGVTDCIEFVKNDNGVCIEYLNGKYDIKVIEYKPTSPKNGEIRETDAIQVFAQKLCVDWMWGCDCEGYIYYSDTRKRVKLPFDGEYGEYFSKTKSLINSMTECIQSSQIPPRTRGQKCGGCSIKDLCMPKVRKYSVRDEIMKEGV